ncbi:MAG: hypothetical protein ACIAQZ_10080 [Sedimentisphaeraceae bacterium JB056]
MLKKIALFFVVINMFSCLKGDEIEEKYNFNVYTQSPCIFKLQDFDMTEPVEAGICFGIECILETYTGTFGLDFPEDFKVTLIIFDDKEKYNQYYRDKFGSEALADGYFSLGDNECVVWKNTDVKQMLEVLFHETQHLLMAHHYPNCPMWLNEGLSQYFQGLNVIGRNKRIYSTNDCKEWNVHWLKTGFPVNPKEYVNLDYDQWNELRAENVTAAYSIGYSMTYFLMRSSNMRKILKDVVLECKKDYGFEEQIIEKNGEKYLYKKLLSRPTTEVFDEYYPGGYDEFESDWKRWIPRSRDYHPVRVMRQRLNATQKEEKQVYGAAAAKKSPQ